MLKYVRNRYFVLKVIIALVVVACSMPLEVRAQDPVAAGQRGMDWLTPATLNWQRASSQEPVSGGRVCFGCHIQGQTLWGLSIGRSQGYRIDLAALQEIVDLLKTIQLPDGSWTPWWEGGALGIETTAFAASGLSFYDKLVTPPPIPAQSNLLMAAEFLLRIQQPDGHWERSAFFWNDSPIWMGGNSPVIWMNVMSTITLNRAFEVTQDARFRDSRDKAITWLKGQNSTQTQDLDFILIGLKEGGVTTNDPVLVARRDSLFALQNPDGGWGSSSGASSNSYNTGQAVYALRLVGATLTDPRIDRGIRWLIANQNPDGSWPIGSSGLITDIAATMWPVIALGRFGVFGVEVVLTLERQELLVRLPDPQTVTYNITINNLGNVTDTFTLGVTGGLPGWTATLSVGEVTLGAGASETVILTVTALPDLPHSLSTTHTVTATSRTDPAVTASGSVTTFTSPPPPPCGSGQICGETRVTIVRGDGAVMSQCDTIPIEIIALELTGGTPIIGPGIGTVNFLVGGVAIGSDTDEDGDGVFKTLWTPGQGWSRLGTQPLVAAYSGLDRPDPEIDLSPSFATGTVTINPNDGDGPGGCPDCPKPEVCNDGVDNDCDGLVDCNDPDCRRPENCTNGVDDDCDGLVDCNDPDCQVDNDGDNCLAPPCGNDCDDNDFLRCPNFTENCGDGVDNDCDGFVDCSDPDCNCLSPCIIAEICNDGIDNDCDGLVDCNDPDCRIDNDRDGCLAPPCGNDCDDNNPRRCPGFTENCNDGIDNDCDRLIDCSDPDCNCPTPVPCECSADNIPPAGCISGKVTNLAGQLLRKDVIITRTSRPRGRFPTKTDGNGCYSRTDLEDGTYVVSVRRCRGGGKKVVVINGGNKVNDTNFRCR